MHLLEKAARSDIKPAPDHIFKDEDFSLAVRRLVAITEKQADLLDNLVTETASLNMALNSFAEDALFNSRLLVSQLRDEAKISIQQAATETAPRAPGAVTTSLG